MTEDRRSLFGAIASIEARLAADLRHQVTGSSRVIGLEIWCPVGLGLRLFYLQNTLNSHQSGQ